jgi:hypothetical protein
MVHALLTLLVVLFAGCALLTIALVALRSGVSMTGLLLVVWIATVALRDSVDLSMALGGIRISALDLLSLLLIILAVVRLISGGVGTFGRGLAFLLLALLAIHLARGAADFGLQTAVSQARGWLYFAAGLVYGATFAGGWGRRVWKLLAAGGLVLAAISVPYLMVDGVHPATVMTYRSGVWVTTRPIAATGALLILQAAILLPALGWPSKRAAVWFALAAGAVVVAVEHRTLWVAGIVVSLVGFVWWSNRRIREGDSTPIGATGVALLLLPFAVWGFMQTGTLLTSAKEITSGHSTFSWRTTSWQELIASHHSLGVLASGRPAGASFERVIGQQVVDQSPHDGFVDAYLRFGIPGVAVICLLGFLLWRRRSAVAAAIGLPAEAVGLLLLTQLVFSVAYTLDSIQGLILGILVSALAVKGAARAPADEPLIPYMPSYRQVRT